MAKFYELLINFMIVGLMIFGIISFIVIVQETNDAPEKIIDDPIINQSFGGLKNETNTFSQKAQTQLEAFESENPIESFGSLIFFSIVSAGKVLNKMVIGVFNILIKLPVTFLGIDPVIVSVLSAVVVITIIIGLWIIYKVGG